MDRVSGGREAIGVPVQHVSTYMKWPRLETDMEQDIKTQVKVMGDVSNEEKRGRTTVSRISRQL